MSKIHINENPMNGDSCHFKQGEWIFDNEIRSLRIKTLSQTKMRK